MMAATKDDKSDWFRAPTSVIATEIDRASGLLATDACRGSGHVGIEYFARGTEPVDACPLHRFDVLRALATAPAVPTASRPPAVGREQTPDLASPPVTRVAVETATSPSADAAPSVKKKPGFWKRVLGVGRDADARGK
jgi:hypothetical protein